MDLKSINLPKDRGKRPPKRPVISPRCPQFLGEWSRWTYRSDKGQGWRRTKEEAGCDAIRGYYSISWATARQKQDNVRHQNRRAVQHQPHLCQRAKFSAGWDPRHWWELTVHRLQVNIPIGYIKALHGSPVCISKWQLTVVGQLKRTTNLLFFFSITFRLRISWLWNSSTNCERLFIYVELIISDVELIVSALQFSEPYVMFAEKKIQDVVK